MAEIYLGLMSGTSLDGVDAVLADFSSVPFRILGTHHDPYDAELKQRLLAIHPPGTDELHRGAELGNALAMRYADAALELLAEHGFDASQVAAIGCHGQTVRHRPDLGFTVQLNNPALLAETTGMTVVADFRSRDIAAGGQGAPLVPAFHAAMFRHPSTHRAIINIGGIANVTDLPAQGHLKGFDCGPGNILLDAWCEKHLGNPYDANGTWAASGRIRLVLLRALLGDAWFALPPPKSTGRDLFNLDWLERHLAGDEAPEDIQATLVALTSLTIARAVEEHCSGATEVYLCGGGARNRVLARSIGEALAAMVVAPTDVLGVDAEWVEAFAFAWLARQALLGEPGNLPEVTGARAPRILGAIYRS
jgi:anhydro-N-acetylmuramic acid kinase